MLTRHIPGKFHFSPDPLWGLGTRLEPPLLVRSHHNLMYLQNKDPSIHVTYSPNIPKMECCPQAESTTLGYKHHSGIQKHSILVTFKKAILTTACWYNCRQLFTTIHSSEHCREKEKRLSHCFPGMCSLSKSAVSGKAGGNSYPL